MPDTATVEITSTAECETAYGFACAWFTPDGMRPPTDEDWANVVTQQEARATQTAAIAVWTAPGDPAYTMSWSELISIIRERSGL